MVSLDTYVCISDPYWQSTGIIIILWKYYVVISDTLIGFWIKKFCGNIITEKSTQKNLCERNHLFGSTPSFFGNFLSLFSSDLSFSTTPVLHWKKIFCSRKGDEAGILVFPPVLSVYGPEIVTTKKLFISAN